MYPRPALWVAALIAVALAVLCPPTAHATGLLLPTDGTLGPLAIRSHRVDVQVHERIAETRVTQVFRNQTDRVLEATYIFPLPAGASVSGFAMTVNGHRQEGQLLEAGEARTIYEGIVARLRDPGLVEYMGGNLFRARVYPIPARGDQTVEIRFTQTLEYTAGTLHYRYPLHTSGPASTTLEDFSLRADITSAMPIRAVYSPTHPIDTVRHGDHHATVGFELANATLDRDFDLYYTVADGDVGLSVLSHHPVGEDGYFLMMLAPRSEVTEHEIMGKDLLFVVDTSGSMAGEKIEHARQALRAWIERLNPDDTFNILRFSTDVEPLADASLAASPENRARALRFITGFEASGGTAIQPALDRALAIPVRHGAPRIVVFLTDGMPTVGETDTARIIADVAEHNHGAAQIFAFGLGDDVNTTFLDLLATQNRGGADYAGSGAEMSSLLASFYNKVAFPVLADLQLALPGVDAYDIYPRDLGTLYRGGQLVVTGRYRTPGATHAALTATVAGATAPRTFDWPLSLPARDDANDFIPRVWASRKVGYLLDAIRLHGENPELRDGVITLARRFGIVTPYTSFLVAEPDASAPVAVDHLRASGLPGNAPFPSGPRRMAAQPTASPSPSPVAPTSTPVAPPQDFRAFQSLAGAAPTVSASAERAMPHHAMSPMGGPTTAMAPPPPSVPAPTTIATGEAGRRVASSLRSLREADQVTAGGGNGTRFVAGRAFVQSNGRWEEPSLPTGARVLRVRSLGHAYYTLLRLRPALRDLLSVGNSVRFRLDDHRVIEVDPSVTDPSDTEVESFVR